MSSLAELAALVAPERLRPLRRAEFERMVEEGLFLDDRIELLQGVLVEVSPQGPRHAATIERLNELLTPALVGRARVRTQLPLAIAEDSLPEPDLAVVPPGDRDRAHPTTAWLVIEVAESSLNKDSVVKAALYAAAGIPEYWVVDLPGRVIEVHTGVVEGKYTTRVTARPGEVLRPVALGHLEIAVTAVLG